MVVSKRIVFHFGLVMMHKPLLNLRFCTRVLSHLNGIRGVDRYRYYVIVEYLVTYYSKTHLSYSSGT